MGRFVHILVYTHLEMHSNTLMFGTNKLTMGSANIMFPAQKDSQKNVGRNNQNGYCKLDVNTTLFVIYKTHLIEEQLQSMFAVAV